MTSACPHRRKRQWRSLYSLTKRGTGGPRMCPPPRARSEPWCWERFPMRDHRTLDLKQSPPGSKGRLGLKILFFAFLSLIAIFPLLSCSTKPDANTLVMIIESSPTNLDPRVGLDAFSERIDNLIFDDLLTRDEHLNVQPQLAERWDITDPLTYIFHLRHNVKF